MVASNVVTAHQPVPSVIAILTCDRVITEAKTNKKTVVGIFDRWVFPQLPAHFQFWLYARLIDAEGEYAFRVKVIRLEDDERLAEALTNPIKIADTLMGAADLALPFPPVLIERPGPYEVQLFANEVFIGRTRVYCQQSD